MAIPVQITFRGLPQSDAIEANIMKHAERLERFQERVSKCRVVVDAPHRHHVQGNTYSVKVDLRLPHGELVVSRDSDADHTHENLYVAIRDAFAALARQLEHGDHGRTRDTVRTHETNE
jgi:ribosomal subunit interface protein